MKASKTKIKRNRPHEGVLSKEYFKILQNDKKTALITKKLLLVVNGDNSCENLGYKLLKTYKDRKLYIVIYSITLKTLGEVIAWITTISTEK